MKQLEENGIAIVKPTFHQMVFGGTPKTKIPNEIQFEITNRRFDLSKLAVLLLGPNYGIAYMFFLYFLMTGAQVGHSSIFASSFAATVPLGFAGTCTIYEDSQLFGSCRPNYWFYLTIYGICMMYLTVRGVKEQKSMQSFLTIMRFLIIGIIVITCLALIAGSSNISNSKHVPFEMPDPINFSTMLSSLPSIFFAFMYQLAFPTIAEFIKDKKKEFITDYIPCVSVYWYSVHSDCANCSSGYS